MGRRGDVSCREGTDAGRGSRSLLSWGGGAWRRGRHAPCSRGPLYDTRISVPEYQPQDDRWLIQNILSRVVQEHVGERDWRENGVYTDLPTKGPQIVACTGLARDLGFPTHLALRVEWALREVSGGPVTSRWRRCQDEAASGPPS